MSDTSEKYTRPPKRWVGIVLVVSLSLNLLIVAAVAGAMTMREKWQPHPGAQSEMRGGPMTRALKHEDRRALGLELRARLRDTGPSASERRAEFDGLIEDLKRVPFDPERVAARLARHRSEMQQTMEVGQVLLLEHLARMSDEDRAAFVDRVRMNRPKMR